MAPRHTSVEHAHREAGKLGFGSGLADLLALVSKFGWAVAALLLLATAAAPIRWTWSMLKPSCSLVYAGSNVGVEFTGFGAGSMCADFEVQAPAYHLAPSSGQLVCQVQLGIVTATVRDRREDPFLAELVCHYLQRRSERG